MAKKARNRAKYERYRAENGGGQWSKAGAKRRPVDSHKDCHHPGGGRFRVGASGRGTSLRDQKLARKFAILDQMVRQGRPRQAIISKATFMKVPKDMLASVLENVQGGSDE